MENKTVKITIESPDGTIKKLEGKAVIGAVMDVDGTGDGRNAAFFVGKSDVRIALLMAANALGETTRSALDNEFECALVAGVMAKTLLETATGDDSNVISKEYKKRCED